MRSAGRAEAIAHKRRFREIPRPEIRRKPNRPAAFADPSFPIPIPALASRIVAQVAGGDRIMAVAIPLPSPKVPPAAEGPGLEADIIEQAAPVVREALLTSTGGRAELESLCPCGGLESRFVGPDGPDTATTNADGGWSLDETPIGAGQFGVAFVADGFAPLAIEYSHGGPLELRRRDQGIGCPKEGGWAAMALAFDPAISTLFAFAEAADRPAEQSGNALLACRWAGAGSCSNNDDWRSIWLAAKVTFPPFVPRGTLWVSPHRVDLTFFVWNDLYPLGCEGDCDDSANWSPLARIADGASYEVGTAAFADGRVGWIGGGLARTAQLGPGRF